MYICESDTAMNGVNISPSPSPPLVRKTKVELHLPPLHIQRWIISDVNEGKGVDTESIDEM